MTHAHPPHRIDTHFHIWAPNYLADPTVQAAIAGLGLGPRPAGYYDWSVEASLEAMDRNGVATSISSCSIPGMHFQDVALGRRLARDWNDYATRLRNDHPGRFGVFAALPLADVEGSLRELDYALDVLGAEGIGLLTRYGSKFVGDESFAPVFEELNRRSAVVYLHPAWAGGRCLPGETGCSIGTLQGPLAAFVETPTDTTRAITTMLFGGTFRRYRNIDWIFSHGGGTIMSVAGRIDDLIAARGGNPPAFPDGIFAELARLHYDIAIASAPANMAALLAVAPVSQLLFGSDYPYLPIETTVRGLLRANLSPSDVGRIERDNALALFPRLRG